LQGVHFAHAIPNFLTQLRYRFIAYKKLVSPPLSSVHPHSFVFLLNAPGGRYKNPIVLRWAPPLVPKATAQNVFVMVFNVHKPLQPIVCKVHEKVVDTSNIL